MRVLTLEEMELVAGGSGCSKGKKSKAKGKKATKAATDLSEDWEKALQESHAAEVAAVDRRRVARRTVRARDGDEDVAQPGGELVPPGLVQTQLGANLVGRSGVDSCTQ